MGDISVWWFVGVAVLIGLLVFARWSLHLGKAIQVERARELFRLQHERFEEMILKAAATSGKPRGLNWTGCTITGDAVLARDLASRQIVAFVPVTIAFEPVPGSDMEDVPAAREPRPATAVFTFDRGHWHTTGRILFNHTPEQSTTALGKHFHVIEHH